MSIKERNMSPSMVVSNTATWGTSVNSYQYTIPFSNEPSERISSDNPRFSRFGNCYHFKRVANILQPSFEGVTPDGKFLSHSNMAYLWNYLPPGPPWDVDLDQLNAEAYEAMKPSLNSGFSLSNFLAELAEMKTLFKLFSRNKTVLSNAAGANLNWNFGWKPFISDLQEIYSKLINMEALLRDYKSKQGLVQKRHYKAVVEEGRIYNASSTEHWYDCKAKYTRDITFHATMSYKYWVPGLDREYAKLRGVLDVLGLKLTPSVIWEAIPFSFVVDWFFNVGDFLASLETDYLESVVEILDYCCSTKTVVRLVYSGAVYPNYGNPYRELGGYTDTYYNRRRCIPDGDNFGLRLSHRYGSKQILLSASLLLA